MRKLINSFIEWLREKKLRARFERCQKLAAKIVENARAQAPVGFDPVCAETLVADVIVPELFTPASIEVTAEQSAFWQSGVLDNDPQFAAIATGAGKTETMPFWNDIQGESQIVTDTDALTTMKIGMDADAAQIHERAGAWSDNDLAGILSGSDPAAMVQNRVGAWWERDMQKMLLATLTGVFSASDGSMDDNQLDIYLTSGSSFTDANYLNGRTFIDAKSKLGDAAGKLVAIAMHSAVEANLRKNDLIDFIPDSEGKLTIATFQGLRVIVDDGMTVEVNSGTSSPSLVYSTYLFGLGAIAWGVGRKDEAIRARPGSTWEIEFDRVSLAGQNIFINRRRMILHPRGVKWTGLTQAKTSPTNAELATANNWAAVYEPKNIRIIRVRHNVDLS
jgi:hypothetical protein